MEKEEEEKYEIWRCSGCESNCIIFMENRGLKEKPHGCFYDWGGDDYDKPNQFELETDKIDQIFNLQSDHTEEYKLMEQRFDKIDNQLKEIKNQINKIELCTYYKRY